MHGWRFPPGKTCLKQYKILIKQSKILKLQTHFSPRIVFTTKVIFYKKKLRYQSQSKIRRHFSAATVAD